MAEWKWFNVKHYLGNVLGVLLRRMDGKLILKLLDRRMHAICKFEYTTTSLSAWLYKKNQWSGSVLTPWGFQLEEKLPVTSGFLEAIMWSTKLTRTPCYQAFFLKNHEIKKDKYLLRRMWSPYWMSVYCLSFVLSLLIICITIKLAWWMKTCFSAHLHCKLAGMSGFL